MSARLQIQRCTAAVSTSPEVPIVKQSRIEYILQNIESERTQDWDKAAAALDLLRKQEISITEGQEALRAAVRPFPSRDGQWRSWPEELVQVAAAKPRPEYVPLVVELFSRYEDRARTQALWLLAQLPDREAAVGYMDIVRAHARTGGIPHLVTQQLEQAPRHP